MTIHKHAILLRCVIGCASLLIPAMTYATDATGSIRFASCSLSEKYRLELVRFQEKKLAKVIILTLPDFLQYFEKEKEWVQVDGEECTESGECRFVMKSEIQVQRVSFR